MNGFRLKRGLWTINTSFRRLNAHLTTQYYTDRSHLHFSGHNLLKSMQMATNHDSLHTNMLHESLAEFPRVLSIQSHVVHGYVGNKCAVFPLQLLGFDVDPLHSVQFSNHTGYPTFKGHVFDGAHLSAILEGLQINGIAQYTYLLTGYIGSVSLVTTIADVVQQLRTLNPNLIYVCDPVMGDEGRLYVSNEVADAIKNTLLPLADVLVPNATEAERLTCSSVSTEAEARAACALLHAAGPRTVVITSLSTPDDPDHITILASTTVPQHHTGSDQDRQAGIASDQSSPTQLRMRVKRMPAYFLGTGDLFAALLLAWMHRHPGDLATALEKTVGGLQAVLQTTLAACKGVPLEGRKVSAEVNAVKELRLIQSASTLVEPPILYRCERLA